MVYSGESSSVMTAKWRKDWLHDGGIGWWVMKPERVLNSDYLAIVYNNGEVDYELIERGPGKHNHITALARGLTIVDRTMDSNSGEWRILIGVKDIAVLPKPVFKPWPVGTNPIKYFPTASLTDAGIDLDALTWQAWNDFLHEGEEKPQVIREQPKPEEGPSYSIAELVEMLAKELNKTPKEIFQKLYA